MSKTIIKKPQNFSLNFKELWSYKELFYFFAWRDIKVRYKQSVLGFLWAVIQPLVLVVAFTLFLPNVSGLESTTIPVLFYFSGLLMWNIFSQGVAASGNSIIENSEMIQKIYFPRLIIPVSAIIVSLFDFLMALLIYIIISIYYAEELQIGLVLQSVLYFISALFITIFTALGVSFLLSALTVKYRDFRYVLGFFVQFMFFFTPVIFSSAKMVDKIGQWAYVNPLTGAIDLIRYNGGLLNVEGIIISTTCALVLFLSGLFYFRKTEAYFADLI